MNANQDMHNEMRCKYNTTTMDAKLDIYTWWKLLQIILCNKMNTSYSQQ